MRSTKWAKFSRVQKVRDHLFGPFTTKRRPSPPPPSPPPLLPSSSIRQRSGEWKNEKEKRRQSAAKNCDHQIWWLVRQWMKASSKLELPPFSLLWLKSVERQTQKWPCQFSVSFLPLAESQWAEAAATEKEKEKRRKMRKNGEKKHTIFREKGRHRDHVDDYRCKICSNRHTNDGKNRVPTFTAAAKKMIIKTW